MKLAELVRAMGSNQTIEVEQFRMYSLNKPIFKGNRRELYNKIVNDELYNEYNGKMVKLGAKEVVAIGTIWTKDDAGIRITIEGRKR